MAEEEAEKLRRNKAFLVTKRELYVTSTEKIITSFQNLTPNNYHLYAGTFEKLKQLEVDFARVQEEILELNTALSDADRIPVLRVQEKFDDNVQSARMSYLTFSSAPSRPAPSQPQTAPPQSSALNEDYLATKIFGPVKIPPFDGNPEKWPTFFNLYNAAVHNVKASSTLKFNRLLSLLSGEPLSMVGTLDITAENYSLAYNMLSERYQREKQCVLRQYRGLLDLPVVTSASDMSTLQAKLREHIHALKTLGHDEESFGNFLVSVVFYKLNNYYRRRLDDRRENPNNYPTLQEIMEFIVAETALDLGSVAAPIPLKNSASKCFVARSQPNLRNMAQRRGSGNSSQGQAAYYANAPTHPSRFGVQPQLVPSTEIECAWCRGPHKIYGCADFRRLSIPEREKAVADKKLCGNCLSTHDVNICKSEHNCQKCSQRHHSFLHSDAKHGYVANPVPHELFNADSHDSANSANHSTAAHHFQNAQPATQTVLPTVSLIIRGPSGKTLPVRALIDSAGQNNFLRSEIAEKLGLQVSQDAPTITGLAHTPVPANGSTQIDLLNIHAELVYPKADVVLLSSLTTTLPTNQITPAVRQYFNSYPLADRSFDTPGPIDLLIGAQIFPHIITGQKVVSPVGPVGLGTVFGFVIMGSVPHPYASTATESFTHHVISMHAREQSQFFKYVMPHRETPNFPYSQKFTKKRKL